MVEMRHRPGKWWRKIDWHAKQRKHKNFRRACVYLIELRAVTDPDPFTRRLTHFRLAQRRRRDLILFLNEAGLTVAGEPATWEELVAAYPLKAHGQTVDDGGGPVMDLVDPDEVFIERDGWEDGESPF